MAITTASLTPAKVSPSKTSWMQKAYGSDASACEEVKAAPLAGNHYIEKVAIAFDGTGTVTIGAGEADSGVALALIGPIPFVAGVGSPFVYELKRAIRVAQPATASLSITVDASVSTGNLSCIVEGFTE